MTKKLLFLLIIMSMLIIPVSAETHTFTYSEGGSFGVDYTILNNIYGGSGGLVSADMYLLELFNDQRNEFCDIIRVQMEGSGSTNPEYQYEEAPFALKLGVDIIASGTVYYTYEEPYIYMLYVCSDGNELKYSELPAGLLTIDMSDELTHFTPSDILVSSSGYMHPSNTSQFLIYGKSSSYGFYNEDCSLWCRDYTQWKNVLSWDDPDPITDLAHMTLTRETSIGDFYSNLTIVGGETTLFNDYHNYDVERTFTTTYTPTYIQVDNPTGGSYISYVIPDEEEGEGEDEELLQFIQTSFDLNSEVGITSTLNLTYNGNSSFYYYDGSMRTSEDLPAILPDVYYEYRLTSNGYEDLYGLLKASSDTYYAGVHTADEVDIMELDSTSGRVIDLGYGHVTFYMQLTPSYAEATCLYTIKVTDNNGTALSGGVLGITDSINSSTYVVFGPAGGAFTINKNVPYTLTVTKDGYNSFSKTVNVSEDFYTEYVTLEETFIAPVPTATPYGYNVTTGTYETPKNVLESIEYALGRIFGIETLSNINIILSGLIILFFALMVGYVVKTGSGLMVGSIVGFVISLALGLIPLWVFFAMILLGLLYFALSPRGGD